MSKENKENEKGMSNKKWLFSIIGIILFSFFAPFIFTRECSWLPNFMNTGQVGDTIGGLMNPFISIAIVMVTWLAFNEQYKANQKQIEALELQKEQFDKEQKEQRKNIEVQKFETQFYEMLRLHKENVNEIEVKTVDGKDVIKGREVFFEMKKELGVLLSFLDDDINEENFKIVYRNFFWGYNQREPDNFIYEIKNMEPINIEDLEFNNSDFGESLGEKLKKYHTLGSQENVDITQNIKINIKRLQGFHSYLGHYYRHLFHTVKFVVNQDEKLISEKQKLDYLRILRAQLSNYEQIILFYNWLSGYGGAWENDKNYFLTKYKMIHNLWYFELYKNSFVKEKLKELVEKYKEQGGEGNLFEIGDNIDKNFS